MADVSELKTDGLCFTPLQGKDSKFTGWNTKRTSYNEAVNVISTRRISKDYLEDNAGDLQLQKTNELTGGLYYSGIGLVHVTSGTCCLDIDNVELATKWFRDEHGIENIMDYLNGHFEVLSPNAKTGKFMFKLPDGVGTDWEYEKIADCDLEFMAGSRQDGWPGSAYWDKKKKDFNGEYSHRGSPELLDLPYDLLKIWVKLMKDKKERRLNGESSVKIDSEHKRSEWYNMLMTGDNYHDSLKTISLGLVKDYPEMNSNEVFDILSSIVIGSSPTDEDRVGSKNRVMSNDWKELRDLIDGAIEKNKLDAPSVLSIEDIEQLAKGIDEDQRAKMPPPPGLLGELAQNAHEMQLYQNYDAAILSAIGLIAGIAGRRFNTPGDPTGLNVYLTLVMKTGGGKDSIRKFISRTLTQIDASSFIGPSRFTGAKSIYNSLKNSRSLVSVFTEAGILLSSKAGDEAGIQRTLLAIYSDSGMHDITGEEAFSALENSMEGLRAPSLSIVSESTPDTLLKVFKDTDALKKGHIPRQSVFRVVGDKPYMNRKRRSHIDEHLIDRLRKLVKKCSEVQCTDDPKAWQMEFKDDETEERAFKLADYYVDLENEYNHVDQLKSIMASRMFLKILKFACIASVFNHESLTIRSSDLDWAVEMAEYEFDGITQFFQGGGFGNVMDDMTFRLFGPVAMKILSGVYKAKQMQSTAKEQKLKMLPLSAVRQALKNNPELNELNDVKFNPITGVDKLLYYMKTAEYIVECNSVHAHRKGKFIRLTESFEMIMLKNELV